MRLDCVDVLSRLNFRSQSWPSVHVPQRCTNVQRCSPCLPSAAGEANPYNNGEGDPCIRIIPPQLVFSVILTCVHYENVKAAFLFKVFFFSQACNCSGEGSASHWCDVLTGHCQCKPAFGGLSCDQCSLGFRDFPDCVACDCDVRGTLVDTCEEEQGLCSCAQETGTCSCKVRVLDVPFSSLSLIILTFGLLTV